MTYKFSPLWVAAVNDRSVICLSFFFLLHFLEKKQGARMFKKIWFDSLVLY